MAWHEMDESGDPLHWILTVQWSADGLTYQVSNSGLLPADVPTRHLAFRTIFDEFRESDPRIPADAVVLFFSLEPNNLTRGA